MENYNLDNAKVVAKILTGIGISICVYALGDKLLRGKSFLSCVLGKSAIAMLSGPIGAIAMNEVDSIFETVPDMVDMIRSVVRKATKREKDSSDET